MKTSIFKKSICVITLPAIVGTICLILMTIAFMVPTGRMYNHVAGSLPMLTQETDYFSVTKGVSGSQLDNYTDALYMNEALVSAKDVNIIECVLSGYIITPQDKNLQYPKTQRVKELSNIFDTDLVELHSAEYRFFNGYIIFVKALLFFTGYAGIRQINLFLVLFLSIFLCLLMYKRGLQKYIIAVIISILFINPLAIALCMTFVGFYYCMIVPCIIMLLIKRETLIKYGWLFFELTGICTFIFNMNYFQLLSFAVPFMFYIIICGIPGNNKAFFKLLLPMFIFWFIGYSGVMVFKWLVYAIALRPEMFKDMIGWFFSRSSTDEGSRLDAILINIKTGFGNVWWNLTEILFLAGCVVKYIKTKTELFLTKTDITLLLCSISVPLIRYFILSNHVIIHNWVTFRLLMIPVFVLNILIIKAGTQNELVKQKQLYL